MSYETRYAARMMMKHQAYLASPEAAERRRLENIALERAQTDVEEAFPSGITPANASEILKYQYQQIQYRKSELKDHGTH